MAGRSSPVAGSGLSILREGLAPGSKGPVRALTSSNVAVTNYEDINSCIGLSASSAVTVGTSATQLTPAASRLRGRRKIVIANGATQIFLGPSTVTASNGLPLAANEKLQLDVLDYGDLYAITSAGTSDVRILELK